MRTQMQPVRKQGKRVFQRTELRIQKKKHSIPPLIAEDIEDDDELDLCAVCDKREPPVKSADTLEAPIDWLQCDNCLTWVHLQCISTRDCTCCGAGFLEIAHYGGSDDIIQEDQEN
ncbi:hypothetical protein COOONC_25623 [Cooperia oncophora]